MKSSILAFAAVASVLHAAPKAATSAPSFYTQSVDANGITIRASSKADQATLDAVKARIVRVLANAPTIAANMKNAKVELHIIARGEKITDLPEYAPFAGKATSDDNSFEHRYHGGIATGTVVVCSEENAMRDASDPYPKNDDVCTHELAHVVMDIGIDSAARAKVLARFAAAKDEGLYGDQYAGVSPGEFFAEGSTHYFGYSGGGLKESDPATYALLDSFYAGAYTNAASPVTDLAALTGKALDGATSTRGQSVTGVILKNKSAVDIRASQLGTDGKIIASDAKLLLAGSDDAYNAANGTIVVFIDDKTKGIVATVALKNDFGRFTVDDKMVKAERTPTLDELTRAGAPIRVVFAAP